MKGAYSPEEWEDFKKQFAALHKDFKAMRGQLKNLYPMTPDDKKYLDKIIRRGDRFMVELFTPEKLCPVYQRLQKAEAGRS